MLADEFDRWPTPDRRRIFTSHKFKVTDQQYRDAVEKALKRVEEAGGVRQVRSFYSTACDAWSARTSTRRTPRSS